MTSLFGGLVFCIFSEQRPQSALSQQIKCFVWMCSDKQNKQEKNVMWWQAWAPVDLNTEYIDFRKKGWTWMVLGQLWTLYLILTGRCSQSQSDWIDNSPQRSGLFLEHSNTVKTHFQTYSDSLALGFLNLPVYILIPLQAKLKCSFCFIVEIKKQPSTPWLLRSPKNCSKVIIITQTHFHR